MTNGLPPAGAVVALLLDPSPAGPGSDPERPWVEIMDPILALHRNNREQWDRENESRRDDADDAVVAAAKREIDRLNSARHGYIEAIDRVILGATDRCPEAPLVTESPGMAIDRLSVLVIRLAATEARATGETVDAEHYAERLPRLRSQLDVLHEAVASLFDDLATGTRRFVPYESLKLYGSQVPGRAG